ncbi:MAG: N-acetyl-gamma-glutamyl-phosphate reductase [Planctomycetota bacterium]
MSAGSPRPKVGIVGATGYAGRELIALIEAHPTLELAFQMGSRDGVLPEPPSLPVDPEIEALDFDRFDEVQGVFLCTPHKAAAPLVLEALARDCRAVDLSADFRLKNARAYAAAYEVDHPAPQLLSEAVYGLTEYEREAVRGAQLVANPGCYPTAALLALKPLLEADLIDLERGVIIDAKSGLSGAGKGAKPTTHFGNVHENFKAYGVGTHRHAPEICQEAGTDQIVFTPHLLPVFRGILETIYVAPKGGVDAPALRRAWSERYADEAFIRVFESGLPELNRVQNTNQCHLGLAPTGPWIALVAAIDNLVKGAAGQALQNMNLMLGVPEGDGLR